MSKFDWDELRYFLAFARAGSMLAAAQALGVNQSTVQRRIAQLEDRTGRLLVERHRGGYRLTELGSELRASVEEVERSIEKVQRQLSASDETITGCVRVTCGSNLGSRLQRSSIVDAFNRKYPDLQLELLISDRYFDLSKGEADLAIRRGQPHDASLVGRKIAVATWSVYASHAYVDRHGRPNESNGLGGHLVVGCDGSIANYPGAQWVKSVVPPATIVTRSDSWPGLVLAVKAGAGLAAMPRWQADDEPGLVRVIDDIGLVMPYYLLMHRDMQRTPRIRAFADFVAAEIKAFRDLLSDGPVSAAEGNA